MSTKVKLELNEIKFSSNKLAISTPSTEVLANQLYQKVLNGDVSAIDTYEAVKFLGEVADVLKKCTDDNGKNNFTDLVREEIVANSDKVFTTKLGSKFSLAETGTKYNFEHCGDPLWNHYNSEIKKLDAVKKKREAFLKTITDLVIISFPDPATGELLENVEILAPIKTSTSSFKVELKSE